MAVAEKSAQSSEKKRLECKEGRSGEGAGRAAMVGSEKSGRGSDVIYTGKNSRK
jgi:hypothetical protein